EIEIIVADLEKEMVDDFENGITEDEERAVVLEISKTDYNGYVKVGFDPRANIKDLEQDLNEMVEELDDVRTTIRQLEGDKKKEELRYENKKRKRENYYKAHVGK